MHRFFVLWMSQTFWKARSHYFPKRLAHIGQCTDVHWPCPSLKAQRNDQSCKASTGTLGGVKAEWGGGQMEHLGVPLIHGSGIPEGRNLSPSDTGAHLHVCLNDGCMICVHSFHWAFHHLAMCLYFFLLAWELFVAQTLLDSYQSYKNSLLCKTAINSQFQ